MKIKAFAALLVLLNFNVAAHAASASYLCIPDVANGFGLKNGKWGSVGFSVSEAKYLVQPETETEFYQVVSFGSTVKEFSGCSFYDVNLICGNALISFVLNTDNLRYQSFRGVGYLEGDELDMNLSFQIGRCSKI